MPSKSCSWYFWYYACRIARVFSKDLEICVEFYQFHRYWPNLKNPRSFSEKIFHRKLYRPMPNAEQLADKFGVRAYVEAAGFGRYLNRLLLVTENPDDIVLDQLPEKFVIKATHGSGWNIIVQDRRSVSQDEIRAQCHIWLRSKYSETCREYHYDKIPAKIIAEDIILDSQGQLPLDYKFYIFHGKCEFIQINYDRWTLHSAIFYDQAWNVLDFYQDPQSWQRDPRPPNLDEMIAVAEGLAKGSDFLRVDLYSPDLDKIYFGEITLTPWAGLERFFPSKAVDFRLGALW